MGLDRYDLPSVVLEDRYQTRSTILTSQLPVARWHEQIGDPTAADGILDRLVHNAHRIDMRGESMRKKWSTNSVSLRDSGGLSHAEQGSTCHRHWPAGSSP